MLKISIIVPVFNTEIYLSECLDSLINQEYKNIEIILIDDGSTDESGKICEEYSKRDKRIIVKHTANKGVTHARRTGLNMASGDYITYVDSDDWIDPDVFRKIVEKITGELPDIIAFGHVKEYSNVSDRRPENIGDGIYSIEEIEERTEQTLHKEDYFYSQVISAMIGGKLVKKELILTSQFAVGDQIRYGEDLLLFDRYYMQAKTIMIFNLCAYHYRVRANSAIQTINNKDYSSCLEFVKCLVNGIIELKPQRIPHRFLYDIFFHILIYCTREILIRSEIELSVFSGVKKGSKVIIYGKGAFSKGLEEYIFETNFVDLLGIVDSSDKEKIFELGNYDYILIALTNGKLVKNIHQSLLGMGIDNSKISYIKNSDLAIEKLPDEVISLMEGIDL